MKGWEAAITHHNHDDILVILSLAALVACLLGFTSSSMRFAIGRQPDFQTTNDLYLICMLVAFVDNSRSSFRFQLGKQLERKSNKLGRKPER